MKALLTATLAAALALLLASVWTAGLDLSTELGVTAFILAVVAGLAATFPR